MVEWFTPFVSIGQENHLQSVIGLFKELSGQYKTHNENRGRNVYYNCYKYTYNLVFFENVHAFSVIILSIAAVVMTRWLMFGLNLTKLYKVSNVNLEYINYNDI